MSLSRKLLSPAAWAVILLPVVGAPGAVRVAHSGDQWTVENDQLRVTVYAREAKLAVLDKAGKQTWTQTAAPGTSGGAPFRNVKALEGAARGVGFDADFAAAGGRTWAMSLKVTLAEKGADLRVEADMSDRAANTGSIAFLHPFVLDSATGAIVVADYSNGHAYPVDLKPFPRKRFNMDMPWIGVCDIEKGHGYLMIAETADDASFEILTFEREGRAVSAPRLLWDASMRTFRYPRRVLYHFSPKGSYVALAKRYRAYAQEQGLLVRLTEKLKKNPNLARAFGAPDVWGNSSLKFARAAKEAGVEKMLIQGGTPPPAADLKAINDLGYLTSKYDIYQDVMPVESDGQIDSRREWVPDNVVLRADGTRMPAWLTWDKKQYMKRCPTFWVRTAERVIPKELAQFPYLGRFIDVTTADSKYECYDPKHPLNNTEKIQRSVEQLAYVRSLNLVTGGEHGRWWAVPQLDFIEGMMSGGSTSWPSGYLKRPKSKDEKFTGPNGSNYPKWEEYEKWGIGHESRVPLWELVFHDCVISTWYWGDSSDFLMEAAPEVTAKKDAFNVLYGTMPMMWANAEGSWTRDKDLFLGTYRNTCKLHEAIATAEMVSHQFVTPDRAVQRTRFSDGTVVVVNFGERPYDAQVGGKSYRLPKNGFAVKGPKIEQSLALVNGRPVTTIKTAAFAYTDAK